MEYKEIWNRICQKSVKNKWENDKILQNLLEDFFEDFLGWEHKYLEGSSIIGEFGLYIKPNIMLRKDRKKLLCIELKSFNATVKRTHVSKLSDFMNKLNVNFGILWGWRTKLQLYYKAHEDAEPVLVCEAKFEENNEMGIKILKLISKKECSLKKLEAFCKNELNKTKKKDERLNFLLSDYGQIYVKELISKEYADCIDDIDLIIAKKPECQLSFLPEHISSGISGFDLIEIFNKNGFTDLTKDNATFLSVSEEKHKYFADFHQDYLLKDWYLIFCAGKGKYRIFKVPANSFKVDQFARPKFKKVEFPKGTAFGTKQIKRLERLGNNQRRKHVKEYLYIQFSSDGLQFVEENSKISFKEFWVHEFCLDENNELEIDW